MAQAEGEAKLVEEVREGGKGWQAKSWILERTRNADFGQKQTVETKVELTQTALPPEPPKDYKSWAERRQLRNQQAKRLQDKATDAELVEEAHEA